MNDTENKTPCVTEEDLSAYLDGDLSSERDALVDLHLSQCSHCRELLGQLKVLSRQLSSLSEVDAVPNTFPAVLEQLESDARPGWLDSVRRFWFVPLTAAAGAAATLLLVFLFWAPEQGGQQLETAHKKPLTALSSVLRAEQTYALAITDMEKAMGQEKSSFSPEVQQVIEQGLSDVDRAIERCRVALRNDPKNLKAHEAMLAAYQHKVDFMTELLGAQL